jgi:cytochrome c peroxidase
MRWLSWAMVGLLTGACTDSVDGATQGLGTPTLDSSDDEGFARTLGAPNLPLGGAFFISLGSNGRTCASCHVPDEGFTIRPAGMEARFVSSNGKDPLFRSHDGAVSPLADLTTQSGRRRAFALLLSKGLVRVGLPLPAGAEFELVEVDDPYGYASARELSMFRRPLPVTNLKFLSAVMWDGRETQPHHSIHFDLREQADHANQTHVEAIGGLASAQKAELSAFGVEQVTAQNIDLTAGPLDALAAQGGPSLLATLSFTPGLNDPFLPGFDGNVFTLFSAWRLVSTATPDGKARRDTEAGERLFDQRVFIATGVAGLNDDLGVDELAVTCSTCHANPNVGNHPVARFFDIGVSDASRRQPELPLYTLRNVTTGELRQTTDPGRALVSGRWRDIGRMKPPILRGIATRSPYFHNGLFADIHDLMDFYDQRFSIGFTATEREQLARFLESL